MKSKFYALLISIDYYLPNQLPSGQYYPSLTGCVWDITLVEKFLQTKLKIPPKCIFKLRSSNGTAGKLSEPLELWPTYENMVAAFQKLADMANKGDQVYIHYSGHGGRTPTKFPELKGVIPIS